MVDAEGKQVGIVSRADLLGVFLRTDEDIRREIVDRVISRELCMDPLGFVVKVHDGRVKLVGQLERRSQILLMIGLVRSVDGVVAVDEELTFASDDTHWGPGRAIPTPWL